jgi:hypothetical protein
VGVFLPSAWYHCLPHPAHSVQRPSETGAGLKGPPSPPVYKQRSTTRAPYNADLKHRCAEDGCRNALPWSREVCARGEDGCCSGLTHSVTQLRQKAGATAETGVHHSTQPKPLTDLPAPSQIRWWFLLPVERLTATQHAPLLLLCQGEAALSVSSQLGQAFRLKRVQWPTWSALPKGEYEMKQRDVRDGV